MGKPRYHAGLIGLLILLLPASATPASGKLGMLAIGGNDPVIYLDHNKAVKGFPQFLTTSDHMVYYFRAQENLDAFMADKEKYTPQFGGNCAWQAAQGKIIAANPDIWTIWQGKIFFFRSEDSRDAWYLNPPLHVRQGMTSWAHYKDEPPPAPALPPVPSSRVPKDIDILLENAESASLNRTQSRGEPRHDTGLYRKGRRIQ